MKNRGAWSAAWLFQYYNICVLNSFRRTSWCHDIPPDDYPHLWKEWVHAKPAFSLLVGASVLVGWGRGHATRTLSGSCHPPRGAALKEAESSRGSLLPPPRWFVYMSSGVRWETEIFPPDLRRGGNTEGREDKHSWSSLFFWKRRKSRNDREFLFLLLPLFCPPTATPTPHLQFMTGTTMASPNCPRRNSATPAQLCKVSRLHKAVFRPSIFNLLLLSLPFSPLSSSLLRSSSRPVSSPALPFIPLTLFFSLLCLTFSFVCPWWKT